MPTVEMEKPARMDEMLNEVSKIKAAVTEAVDDGVHSALRAVNRAATRRKRQSKTPGTR